MDDPRAIDVLHRDGHILESFSGFAVMLTSWTEQEKILSTLSLICGREAYSTVEQVLVVVKDADVRNGILLLYRGDKERDGTFASPSLSQDAEKRRGCAVQELEKTIV